MIRALIRVIVSAGLIVGLIYKNDCPVEHFIPIFLIVCGSISLLANFIELAFACCDERNRSCTLFLYFINGFLAVCFLAGSYWTFSIFRPEYKNAKSDKYCNEIVYLFSFCMILSVALLAIILLITKYSDRNRERD